MSRTFHPVRLLALLALIGLLVGVPCVVFAVVGVPLPGASQLAAAWSQRRVPGELVVRCGLAVFAVLWLWFAVTALGEFVHVWAARRSRSGALLAPVQPGPSRWVRRLVRVVAVGSVSAGATFGSMGPMLRPTVAQPVRPTAPSVTVVAPVPAAPSGAATQRSSSDVVPFASGVGTALLLSAGAVSLLEARRRRRWRAADVGARLAPPTPEAVHTETLLRSLGATERVMRLDLALRSVAADLAAQGAVVLAAVLDAAGAVRLHVRGAAAPSDPMWAGDLHSDTWRLGAEVTLAQLAAAAGGHAQPCPAMVHLGAGADGGEVFVDLEAVGVLTVQSPWSLPILRSIACSLALSPLTDVARVLTVGLSEPFGDAAMIEPVPSLADAVRLAHHTLGSTAAQSASTFALRARGVGGESWEPCIVVAAGEVSSPELAAQVRAVGAGRGLAVVVDRPGLVGGWTLDHRDGGHMLEPLGVELHPVGLTEDDVEAVRDVLDAADESFVTHADVVPFASRAVAVDSEPGLVPFVEREWSLMVRVLGPVEVVSDTGQTASFDRSKSLELVVWLSQHRERSTRAAARTALWDLDVRDATFANVVSEARRSLARAVPPAEGDEWIGRTLTEQLPLHPGVVTDGELLADRVAFARGLAAEAAVAVLRPGVELLAGLPFAGTSYLWTDAEGITSSLVLLATGAAIELADHYLALGDVDGVFWATGQGLKVLAGHEELIALRMRAHWRRGDLAGVRSEWESYERALAADPWAAAEPAPKLVALRRELLGPQRALA